MHSGVEHHQVSQIANFKAAVNRCLITGLGRTDRHPLMVGLAGCTRPDREIALSLIVIFCTASPAVIGQLMIVPHSDKWMPGVHCLQVCICAIQPITHAIVFNTKDFIPRLYLPAQLLSGYRVGIDSLCILIDIVT